MTAELAELTTKHTAARYEKTPTPHLAFIISLLIGASEETAKLISERDIRKMQIFNIYEQIATLQKQFVSTNEDLQAAAAAVDESQEKFAHTEVTLGNLVRHT